MIVHHAYGLHVSVADSRTDKIEPALLQVLAHCIGLSGARRDVLERAPAILLGLPADELPDVTVKPAELVPQLQEGARILDRGLDLQAIADNRGVSEKLLHPFRIVPRDFLGVEVVERLAVILALV